MTDPLAQFERWLRQGHEHAIEHVRRNDSQPLRDAILHACHTDLRYDPRCEHFRGPFLARLLEASGDLEFYMDAIRRTLENCSEPEVDYGQLFKLIQTFEPHNSPILIRCFERLGFDRAGTYAAETLIQLEGLPALELVCETLHEVDSTYRPWTFESLLECLPADQREGHFTGRVAHYFNEWRQQCHVLSQTPIQPRLSYFEIRAQIQEKGRRFRNASWAKQASEEELSSAANDLAAERNPDIACGFLRLFVLVPFPGDLQLPLEATNHSDPDVSDAALLALRNQTDPRIRELALQCCANLERKDLAVELLIRNGGPGDYPFIESLLSEDTDDYTHALGCSILEFSEAHPGEEAIPSLHWVYENSPCSFCIGQARKQLGLKIDW